MQIVATDGYLRQVKKLLSADERTVAETEIVAAPELWPVIRGSGGCRKARVARGGKGKSGGARIIYFFRSHAGSLYLLMAYAKNEQENLTHEQLKAIRDRVKALA